MGKNSSADWVAYRPFNVITSVNLIASRATVEPAANTNITSCNGCIAVIELSGVGSVHPPVHFSTPQLILKNYLGGQAKPPEQRLVTQCILLSACIQRFPTRVISRGLGAVHKVRHARGGRGFKKV